MAEGDDKDSKTEEPTEKKISDAIDKGNVPSSREVATLTTLVAVFIVGTYLLSGNVARVHYALAGFIDNPGDWPLESSADVVALFMVVVRNAAPLVVPVILLVMIAGIGAALAQNPPQMVADRIQPKWSRVSLAKGWRRLFSLRGLVDFGKALFKLTAVGMVGYMVFKASQDDVLGAMFMEPVVIPELARKIVMRIVGWVALLTLALVIGDVLWSRVDWRRELRMTKQEVKDERKQMEGDPHIKARQRGLARSRARKRMIAAVPQATLVVTNPTHYAVALRYVRSEGGAPKVLAKGMGVVAQKIREVAENHGIPIVEDKPLARSLYEAVDVDKLIPPQFYKAVAEIIYYLHLRRKR
jgi:flagellar biosynthetic protein FlhB